MLAVYGYVRGIETTRVERVITQKLVGVPVIVIGSRPHSKAEDTPAHVAKFGRIVIGHERELLQGVGRQCYGPVVSRRAIHGGDVKTVNENLMGERWSAVDVIREVVAASISRSEVH